MHVVDSEEADIRHFVSRCAVHVNFSCHLLYINYTCIPDSLGWDRGQDGEFSNGRDGKSGALSHSSDVIDACTCINSVELNVCGSTLCCGCVVNGYTWLPVKYYIKLRKNGQTIHMYIKNIIPVHTCAINNTNF